MTSSGRDLLPALTSSLDRLARRPLVVLALVLLVNAVVLPYRGLYHDARLYAASIQERIEPGSLADDLYLRYGSHDSYSIFSAVMVPLARKLGLEAAFFLGYVASKVLFFWALLRLVNALVPERVPALAAMVYLAMAPLPFGGNEVFHLNESFLTPRIAACALVLLGMERVLAGRMLASAGLCALAMTLHPLMAFGGMLVVAIWWALERLPVRLFAVLCAAAVALGAMAVGIEPLGRRLFGHMDDEWHEVYMQICFFIDPAAWSAGDWLRIALAVGLVGMTAWQAKGADRMMCTALLLAAAAGMAGTFVAAHSRYALLLQASPYRTLWLTELLAIPLGFRACWRAAGFMPTGINAAARLPGDHSVASLISAFLVVLLTTDWNRTPFPAVLVFVAVLPVWVVFVRGLGRRPHRPDWAARVALGSMGLTAGLLLLWNAAVVAVSLNVPARFDRDIYLVSLLVGVGDYLFKLPLLVLTLGVVGLAQARAKPQAAETAKPQAAASEKPQAALVLAILWLLYLGGLTVLDASESYAARYSARAGHVQQVAGFLKEQTARQQGPVCVYWSTDLREIWFVAGAQSYLNKVQMSGCGFNRGTALEGRRRAWRIRAFEGPLMHAYPIGEQWWQKTLLHFLGDPEDRPATEDDLRKLSADEQLDYAVLEVPFEGWYVASTGRWYIYDCAWLRQMMPTKRGALPPAAGRVSISAEQDPSPKRGGELAGGNHGHPPANE
jgi:hypothetical protein